MTMFDYLVMLDNAQDAYEVYDIMEQYENDNELSATDCETVKKYAHHILNQWAW